jgi:hypothetical protein
VNLSYASEDSSGRIGRHGRPAQEAQSIASAVASAGAASHHKIDTTGPSATAGSSARLLLLDQPKSADPPILSMRTSVAEVV